MFPESPADLIFRRKASFTRRLQAAIYSREFFRGRMVRARSQSGIDFERNLRKFGLGLLRPLFYTFENVFQYLRCHRSIISNWSAFYS